MTFTSLRMLLVGTVMAAAPLGLAQQPSYTRITNGVNVRLRAAPGTTAPIVIEMPVGTELAVLEQKTSTDGRWFHVRTSDGREGWVLGQLTSVIDSAHYLQTIERITRAQVAAHAQVTGTSFETRVQVFDLIERTSKRLNEREAVARLALLRLYALQDVLLSIPVRESQLSADSQDPYQRWLTTHLDESSYDEPGGQWLVDPDYVLRVHEQYQNTKAADEIAWFHATNSLGGECEGYLPCYVARVDKLYGEYLRLHPKGQYARRATANIATNLAGSARSYIREDFRPEQDCAMLQELLKSLTSGLKGSSAADSADASAALKTLGRLSKLCN